MPTAAAPSPRLVPDLAGQAWTTAFPPGDVVHPGPWKNIDNFLLLASFTLFKWLLDGFGLF